MSEAVKDYTFITDWLAGELWDCEAREIIEFVCQISRTDAHRCWKHMETRH